MTGHVIYILFVFIVVTDLAHSNPKLQRSKIQINNLKKLWGRQKIESVESTKGLSEVENNDQVMLDDEINEDSENPNHVTHEDHGPSPKNIRQQADDDRPADLGDDDGDQKENPAQHNDPPQIRYTDGHKKKLMGYYGGFQNIVYDTYEYLELTHNRVQNHHGEAIKVGDTFTAQQMLPIAKKLMMKVGIKGEGKGIISSTTNPKDLADILFERFFLTMKRIVILNDVDISGLDALHTLALSGDAAETRPAANSLTESPANGKMLRKRIQSDGRKNALRKYSKRRRVNLARNLSKNRKLVVNPARRGSATKNKNHKHQKQLNQNIGKNSKKNIRSNKGYRSNIKRKHNTSKNKIKTTRDKIGTGYDAADGVTNSGNDNIVETSVFLQDADAKETVTPESKRRILLGILAKTTIP